MAFTDTGIRTIQPSDKPFKLYDEGGFFFANYSKRGVSSGVLNIGLMENKSYFRLLTTQM